MPTTHVEPLPNFGGRLNYVTYGSGPEGTRRRNAKDAARPLDFWCDFGSREQMAAYARNVRRHFGNRKYEGYEIRVSWSRDELVPENPDDVARAMEFGHALVKELFGDSPYSITAHGDGLGRCLHLHIDVVNVTDTESLRAIRGPGRVGWYVRAVSDTIARERGMNVVVPKEKSELWSERSLELESQIDGYREKMAEGDKWPRALRDATVALRIGTLIDRVITREARNIHSVEDFEHHLAGYGVGIQRKQLNDGTEGWTYTAEVELEGKSRKRRCKASKILRSYSADKILETIEEEAERQRSEEEAQRQRQAEEERLAREAAEFELAERRRRRDEERARKEAERSAAASARKTQSTKVKKASTSDSMQMFLGNVTSMSPAERKKALAELAEQKERAKKEKQEAERQAVLEKAAADVQKHIDESRIALKELMEKQERERKAELERAVAFAEHDDMTIVTVNAAVFGGEDSPWRMPIRSQTVRTYANAALQELPRGTSDTVRIELENWRDGVEDPIYREPEVRVGSALNGAMHDGVHGEWEEPVPKSKWAAFAEAFKRIMNAPSSSSFEYTPALRIVCGMYSLACEQMQSAKTTLRERARQVLAELGLAGSDARRGKQDARNVSHPYARDVKTAEIGSERTEIERTPEKKPSFDIDRSRLVNFGDLGE